MEDIKKTTRNCFFRGHFKIQQLIVENNKQGNVNKKYNCEICKIAAN